MKDFCKSSINNAFTTFFLSNIKNMSFLLKRASSLGIYKIVDYSKYPVTYCGMKIDSSPINKY